MLLDLFFKAAVPFTILCLVAAKVVIAIDRRRGIYATEEGERRRDRINREHRTTRGALVIALIFLVLWILTIASLIEEWGAIFFTFVVGALILIPYMTVCAGAIALYMFVVHARANAKAR